jgi:hypothetical protein
VDGSVAGDHAANVLYFLLVIGQGSVEDICHTTTGFVKDDVGRASIPNRGVLAVGVHVQEPVAASDGSLDSGDFVRARIHSEHTLENVDHCVERRQDVTFTSAERREPMSRKLGLK